MNAAVPSEPVQWSADATAADSLRADMAHHQRVSGREVTDPRNHGMVADLLQRIERETADAAPVSSAPVPDVPSAPTGERRVEGEHGRYLFDTTPAPQTLARKASEAEHLFFTHAMARVELLLTKLDEGPLGQPSWHQRVMGVMGIKLKSEDCRKAGLLGDAAEIDRRYMFELMTLLEESNATFGDWKADKPRRIQVG